VGHNTKSGRIGVEVLECLGNRTAYAFSIASFLKESIEKINKNKSNNIRGVLNIK
jgi:hypothetical protein